MDIRLIAFDLDGTFLNHEKEIPPRNLDAIRAAAEAGIWIVPASGRLYNGMPDALKLPFIRYYICGNGLCVYDAQENKELFSYTIPNELALRTFDYAEQLGLPYDCYQNNRALISHNYLERIGEIITEPAILKFVRSIREPVGDLRAVVADNGEPVQKIQFYFRDPQERRRQLALLPRLFPEYCISSSISCNIEINIAAAHKGHALDTLTRRLGFTPAEAMAFGDGINDISMLQTAGLGVAMANAEPSVLAAADAVTASCDEAGVAQAIETYALKRAL